MEYKASIVIPVYNAAKTVRKCVESIVYGQEKAIKIILVEDCSSDTSWDECLELQNEFETVFCVKNEKNSGVSYTRNHGLKYTEGKFVLFVDSDDWVSGTYAKKLLTAAMKYHDSMVVCGFHFTDYVNGIEQNYLYNHEKSIDIQVIKEHFFELNKKTLLQLVWNKAFRKDIIDQYGIRFDETQSMGEDFLFVLDYMRVANIETCVVLNEPLYYYARVNSNSLMSKFGLSGFEKEVERYNNLFEICGKNNIIVQDQYKQAIEDLKKNFVYQIMHANLDKKAKVNAIESIMDDGKVMEHYRANNMLCFKENVYLLKEKVFQIIPRIKNKIKTVSRKQQIKKEKNKLKENNFSIISQNCIGGVFYNDMGLEFLSPTINLFLEEPDFIKYAANLKYYNSIKIKMEWLETYPIGYLDDVCIHFMHYSTCKDAMESWNRRKKRINYDNIVILATDRDGFDEKCFEQWENLLYKKVLYTCNKNFDNSPQVVYFEKYSKEKSVPDLIPEREFYKDDILINTINA